MVTEVPVVVAPAAGVVAAAPPPALGVELVRHEELRKNGVGRLALLFQPRHRSAFVIGGTFLFGRVRAERMVKDDSMDGAVTRSWARGEGEEGTTGGAGLKAESGSAGGRGIIPG